MRVGIAHVEVRANLATYQTDLERMKTATTAAVDKVNTTLSKLGTSHTKVSGAMKATADASDKVTAATKRQGKSLLTLIPHVAQVTIAYMAMRAAWRGIMSGMMAGVEFEQKMSVVKAISRATAEEFVRLGAAARTMARDTVFTATEAADALKFLAMAGFSANEAISALPGVLQLALIGELELGRATDIATDTLKAFGLVAYDLARVNDVMVATITRSNTNIEMMGQSMKFAAPVARALGYEIEQVAAMIGVLATAGIKAGIAGRGLQQGFVRTTKAAKEMGLEVGSNLIAVLKAFNKEEAQLRDIIGETAARTEINTKITKAYGLIALKTMLVLRDNIGEYERLEKAAYNSAGESAKAALIMQDNVSSSWKLLKSMVSEISITLFEDYKVQTKIFLGDITKWFKDNKDAIVDWAEAFLGAMSGIAKEFGGFVKIIVKGWALIFEQMDKSVHVSLFSPLAGWQAIGDMITAYEMEAKGDEIFSKVKVPDLWDTAAMVKYREDLHLVIVAQQKLNWEKQRAIDLEKEQAEASKRAALVQAEGATRINKIWKQYREQGYDISVEKELAEMIEKLPTAEKEIYDRIKAIAEFKSAAEAMYGDIEKMNDAEKEAVKAIIAFKVTQFKKGYTEAANFAEKTQKLFETYAQKEIKVNEDKYAAAIALIEKAELEQIKAFDNVEKAKELHKKGIGIFDVQSEAAAAKATVWKEEQKEYDKQLKKYQDKEKGKYETMRDDLDAWAEKEITVREKLGEDAAIIYYTVATEHARILGLETAATIKETRKQKKAKETLVKDAKGDAEKSLAIDKELYDKKIINVYEYAKRVKEQRIVILTAEIQGMRDIGKSESELYRYRLKMLQEFATEYLSIIKGVAIDAAKTQSEIWAEEWAADTKRLNAMSGYSKVSNVGGIEGLGSQLDVKKLNGIVQQVQIWTYNGEKFANKSLAMAAAANNTAESLDMASDSVDLLSEASDDAAKALSDITNIKDKWQGFLTDREREGWSPQDWIDEFYRLLSLFSTKDSLEDQIGALDDIIIIFDKLEDLNKQQLATQKETLQELIDQGKSIEEWLWEVAGEGLAPAEAEAWWMARYEDLLAGARKGEEIDKFLEFAKAFLEFQQSYAPSGYNEIYDAVIRDVIDIQALNDMAISLAEIGYSVPADELYNMSRILISLGGTADMTAAQLSSLIGSLGSAIPGFSSITSGLSSAVSGAITSINQLIAGIMAAATQAAAPGAGIGESLGMDGTGTGTGTGAEKRIPTIANDWNLVFDSIRAPDIMGGGLVPYYRAKPILGAGAIYSWDNPILSEDKKYWSYHDMTGRVLQVATGLKYGGIVSGPESGYPVVMHGKEVVSPLVDGKVPSDNSDLIAELKNQNDILLAILAKEMALYIDGKEITGVVKRGIRGNDVELREAIRRVH